MVSTAVSVWLTESVTVTDAEYVPAWVGVPVSAPLAARVNPGGSGPGGALQLSAPCAPVAASTWLYERPTSAAARDAVVICGGWPVEMICAEKACCALARFASCTCTVRLKLRGDAGVPVMLPFEVLNVSSGGRSVE